ncbi:hypothetical protein BH160DRAFT_3648 [Burkholderia sp. H160]|nr:hypothetical protein BH160DRAFT_3648 [Burkholderia sp. H160]
MEQLKQENNGTQTIDEEVCDLCSITYSIYSKFPPMPHAQALNVETGEFFPFDRVRKMKSGYAMAEALGYAWACNCRGRTENPSMRRALSSSTGTDNHWIAFRLNEYGSCEGLRCVGHFRDGSKAYGTFSANNTVRFERADNGNACARIELLPGDGAAVSGSVTESILSAIAS